MTDYFITISDDNITEVTEAVRCKDCKHWIAIVDQAEHGACDQWQILNVTARNDYCVKGEPKNE